MCLWTCCAQICLVPFWTRVSLQKVHKFTTPCHEQITYMVYQVPLVLALKVVWITVLHLSWPSPTCLGKLQSHLPSLQTEETQASYFSCPRWWATFTYSKTNLHLHANKTDIGKQTFRLFCAVTPCFLLLYFFNVIKVLPQSLQLHSCKPTVLSTVSQNIFLMDFFFLIIKLNIALF